MRRFSTTAVNPFRFGDAGNWRLPLLAALLLAAATLGVVFFGVVQAQDANGAINGLTLTSDSPGTLVVSWDMPSPAPSDYRVDWAKSGESYQSYKVEEGHVYPEGSVTTVTITDLEAGAEYKVRMRARYNQGEHANSPWSGPWQEAEPFMVAEPTPEPTAEPAPESEPEPTAEPAPEPAAEPTEEPEDGAIGSPTATGDNAGGLVIAWQAPQAPHDAPTDYRVNWARSVDDYPSYTEEHGNAHPATPTHTLEGLDRDTKYKIRIRARYSPNDRYDAHWSGPWTEITARVVSSPPSAPAAPTLIGTAVTSEGHVTLLWLDPADDTITGYRVLRGPDADSLAVIREDTGSTAISYTDTEPTAGQTHAYAVQARNAAGLSPLSNTLTATVPQNEEEPVAVRQETVTTLVTNLGNTGQNDMLVRPDKPYATTFVTAPGARIIYKLSGVEIRAAKEVGSYDSPTPQVSLYRDADGLPGSQLYTLTGPDDFLSVDDTEFRTYTFTAPQGASLDAGVAYWVVFAGASGSTHYRVDSTTGTAQTGDGWSIGDISMDRESGGWLPTTIGPAKFAVLGAEIDLQETVTTLVTNLGNTGQNDMLVRSDKPYATAFVTAAGARIIYKLDSVLIRASKEVGSNDSPTPQVSLYRDARGRPGSQLYTLTGPDDFLSVDDTEFRTYTFTAPQGAILDADAVYWVVFAAASGSTEYIVDSTTDTAQTGDGWSIGGISVDREIGRWLPTTIGPAKFAILGNSVNFLQEEPDVDLPGGAHDCHLTDRIVLPGHTSSGHLTAGVDTSSGLTGDCFRLETQWGQQYRVEVKFGDTESVDIGGSAWIVYTGSDFSSMSSLGSAVDHNREDGRTFTDFKHNNSTVKSYFVDVAAYDLYSTPHSTNSLTYNGPYTITLTDITGVKHMTNNRHESGDVNYFESSRLDLPAGTSADFGQSFTTGGHAGGYTLDRISVPFAAIAAAGASPNIAIHILDSSGNPSTKLCDIAVPTKIFESALTWGGYPPPYDFLAPDCANNTLAASTQYAVVFLRADIAEYTLEMTSSSDQDSRGSGWELADGIAFKSTSPGWDYIADSVIRIELWAKER